MSELEIEQVGTAIHDFLTVDVEKLARKTGFVQRKSKLTGTKFAQAMVFNSQEKRKMTLSTIAQSCLDLGVRINEQSVDERFTPQSVEFMRLMAMNAATLLRQKEPLPIEIVKQFKAIYLVDSTQIALPPTMAELFPGAGGNASTASLKVQLAFDYLHGHFEKFELKNGRQPDQGYHGHRDIVTEGSLMLCDLGYFVLDTFKEISDKKSFFLSRFQAQTAIYDTEDRRLELKKLLPKKKGAMIDCDVLLGGRKKHRIPCRLIAVRLPKKIADERRRRARLNAESHGRTPSSEWHYLLGWSIFITNVPQDRLHAEHVPVLYQIRWQIELLFKLCKSYCALDHVTSVKPERVLTEFYARIIGVILTCFLLAPARMPISDDQKREVSPFKAHQIFQRFARFFTIAIQNLDELIRQIRDFYRHLLQFAFKQKRVKQPNSLYSLVLISACYQWNTDELETNTMLT